VPGAVAPLQESIRYRAREHYNEWCGCRESATGGFCGVWGFGNNYAVYDVSVSFLIQRQTYSTAEEKCLPVEVFPLVGTARVTGPIFSARLRDPVVRIDECGPVRDFTYELEIPMFSNGCEGTKWVVVAFATGIRNVTLQNVSGEQVVLFEEDTCPPSACQPQPPFVLPELPVNQYYIDFADQNGENYVTTIIVRGEDGAPGKDGKNINLAQVDRVPFGSGNVFELVSESDTDKDFRLQLEDELDIERTTIKSAACDLVTGELAETTLDIVLPIATKALGVGWGVALQTIAELALIAARVACEQAKEIDYEIVYIKNLGVTESRQTVEDTFFPLGWGDDWTGARIRVFLAGTTTPLPSSVPMVDTFNGLESEGQFGLLYLVAEQCYSAEPLQMRHINNFHVFTDRKITGFQLVLPRGVNVGVVVDVLR
jgi:hypothetical protein